VPGVPYEMTEMVTSSVLPDLLERSGERAVIVSRSLKTWGASESGLAEMIAERVDQQTNPTIAFLARGIEGIYVRMTAKAPTEVEARTLLDAEDRELRSVLGELVFAVDDETMESEVQRLCEARGWTLGVAESLTGGFIGARLANVPGASRVFRGSIASYATEVKHDVLGVTAERVVTEEAAKQMAEGAQRVLGADVGISATGVAGPDEMEGQPVGTVWYAIAIPGRETEAVTARLPFDRERIRQFSTISVLNLLRMRLLALP
jgi:nicotinamide-nucleotide amidase